MRFYIASLFLLTLTFLLSSCSPKHADIVVAKYDNSNITMHDFETAYAKNAGGVEEAKKDSLDKLKNFLDLYVKFKMKLRDAYIRGYDTNPEVVNELNDYKEKVGATYILEKYLVDPGIDSLYNRRKWEFRVSHIMFRPDSSGDAGALKKANEILDSIKNGASFEEMAKKYSDDKFSKSKGGDIFYITAGQVPPAFEDAVYSTAPGHVYPEVVKSPYGYHIIKVTEKRKRIPKIRASHILASFSNGQGKIDSAAAKAKIDTVMEKLKNGANFAELAEKYSDDPGSKKKGGDLGFFARRQMVPEFDEAAFNLKKVGDVSGIVKSPFGYHIIKLTGIQDYPSLDAEKDELKKIFQKTRYQKEYNKLIDSLKKQFNYNLVQSTFGYMKKNLDSLRLGMPLNDVTKLDDKVLYTYANDSVMADKFVDRMANNSDYANKMITPNLLEQALNKFSGDDVLDAAALDLDKTNKDFASLMNDYKNGIYIFKLQDSEVWSKLKIDSTKLHDYYDTTKSRYQWPDRVDVSEIFSKSDSLINYYYSLLQKGGNFDTLASKYTEKPGMKEKAGYYGLMVVKDSKTAQIADSLNEGGFSKPFPVPGGYAIVKLNKKDPAHIKSFEEAKAEVSSAYQEYLSSKLTNDYSESLDKIYKPKLYYDKLEEAFKKE